MEQLIHQLPDFVANQIAAGEVVQRPASIIKELMENSVDAGADKIDVWVTDAGKTSIHVIDNGKGMNELDARMAFARHATSKIRSAADLFKLTTMGFRGEALASIAAVAQVQLKTRTIDDEIGTFISLNGANVVEQYPVACERGAQFIVNNIFFNIPARRRFLKSNTTEFNNIMQEFERIALIHPDIEFTLHRDDSLVLDLRQTSLKARITDLFGQSLDKQLLPVHVETSIVKIDGFVGTPESAKAKGVKQFFFVNERYMKHPYFHRAVLAAFEKLVPADRQVPYFYTLEVAPSRIDVNIHPTKTEIKFEDEQAIWQILLAATREALGKFNAVPVIDFQEQAIPEIPPYNPESPVGEYKIKLSPGYDPFANAASGGYSRPKVDRNWQQLYGGLPCAQPLSQADINIPSEAEVTSLYNDVPEDDKKAWGQETFSYVQFSEKYIVISAAQEILLVDQHRAHIRILYDRYLSQLTNRDGVSQGLLFPELFQLTVAQANIFESLKDDFVAVGFDIAEMGGGSYAVKGVPAGAEKHNPVELITRLISDYNKRNSTREAVYDYIALSLARSNALPYARRLSQDEMKQLVEELQQTSSPKYTPDGKLVVASLDRQKVEGLFK